MTREEVISTIETAAGKGAYTESVFGALPDHIRYGVEAFWEPGYDYSDLDFWGRYEDLTQDFVEAVIRYNLMRAKEDGEEE